MEGKEEGSGGEGRVPLPPIGSLDPPVISSFHRLIVGSETLANGNPAAVKCQRNGPKN